MAKAVGPLPTITNKIIMDRGAIKEILRDVFGHNLTMQDIGGWVSIQCPLAPWTHERGRDGKPSAGVSINVTGTSMFNCLAGDTKVITRDGVKSIKQLAGTSPELLMPDGTWLRAPVKAFGPQQLRRIDLSRNGRTKVIYATGNHRWFAKSGDKSAYLERTTDQLKPGYRLQPALPASRDQWALDTTGVLHGLVYGDGTRQIDTEHGSICLFGECKNLASMFVGHGVNTTYYPEGGGRQSYVRLSGRIGYMKTLPSMDNPESYLLGFLSGLIAADGHVDERGNVSLASAELRTLQRVKDICVKLGIAVFGIYGQMRRGFGRFDSSLYTMRFIPSTLHADFFVKRDQKTRFAARTHKFERLCWSIVSVEDYERAQEVYCAEVPGYHAFTLDGNIVTGNCFTCHNPGPFHKMLAKYADFSGENLEDLIEELAEEEYLGPKHLPDWDTLKQQNVIEPLMPINEGIFMDLYDSAAGHPYLDERGIDDSTATKLELLFDPKDSADGEPRILFPVRGPDGLLYGFSGRATRNKALLKVRDYHGLKKAHMVLGAHLVTQDNPNEILVVEGLFDYANTHQCGYYGCGVMHSTLTDPQAEIIRGLSKPTYLFYDNPAIDKAGADGVRIAGKKLRDYVPVMQVRYPLVEIADSSPEGYHLLKDPGEMIAEDFEMMIRDSRLY